jgi:tRNA (guanine10-N2)-methyltransferase
LSTSSLPADRALLLCNLALANAPSSGAGVLDPYCGSGGTLLAAAALGAWTVGSDLDWRLVSDNRVPIRIPATATRPGRGVEAVRMRDNFDEAGLPHPAALLTLDVGAPDAASRLLAGSGGRRYDALVCDPPYGRREFQQGALGWAGELTFKVDAAALVATLVTLLRLARATLRPGGRLVFLAPVRSPRDASKPDVEALRGALEREGLARDMGLVHIGVEAMHRSLHRAAVVMERIQRG